MKITDLEIYNFRGIKNANISFPNEERVICLIGAGDSTKSTILQAIEWILWPSGNLNVSDSDFFECDISSKIVLRGTFSEIPERLLAEEKFGLYLRKLGVPLKESENDEPIDGIPFGVTVQLTIDGSLDPQWEVVCNRNEPKAISFYDRKSMLVNKIGSNCTKDMMWGRLSILQKYADSKGAIQDMQMSVLRDIAQKVDFQELNIVSDVVKNIGKEYGVGFNGEISNQIQIQGISFSTLIGLFDGKTPLSQRGLGSQRLLSMGLNINASSNASLLLIDEIESGLEPYRLRSIINELRLTHDDVGQVILTTHSPIAVAECTINEILIVHSNNGTTKCIPLKSGDEQTNRSMQAQVRRNAEAILSKRIIVCEGMTEQGFIRALDTYLAKEKGIRMAFNGVGIADGNGSSALNCADQLLACGYEVCLLMDSDKEDEQVRKEELKNKGIQIFDWDKPNSIEEQIFYDVPIELANKLIQVAISEKSIEAVKNKLNGINYIDDHCNLLDGIDDLAKREIGSMAKSKGAEWYKRIDLGEKIGDLIFSNLDNVDENAKLRKVITGIIDWVMNSD